MPHDHEYNRSTNLYKFICTTVKKNRYNKKLRVITYGDLAKKLNNETTEGTEFRRKANRTKAIERHASTVTVASPSFTGGKVFNESWRKIKTRNNLHRLFGRHWRKACFDVLRQWKGVLQRSPLPQRNSLEEKMNTTLRRNSEREMSFFFYFYVSEEIARRRELLIFFR